MTKIFNLNDCDWVAANSLEEAIGWYLKETGLPADEALDGPHEVENPSKMMVVMERIESNKKVNKYAELQEKYLKEDEDIYEVPANELLAIDWEGKPFIFCSTEY